MLQIKCAVYEAWGSKFCENTEFWVNASELSPKRNNDAEIPNDQQILALITIFYENYRPT